MMKEVISEEVLEVERTLAAMGIMSQAVFYMPSAPPMEEEEEDDAPVDDLPQEPVVREVVDLFNPGVAQEEEEQEESNFLLRLIDTIFACCGPLYRRMP